MGHSSGASSAPANQSHASKMFKLTATRRMREKYSVQELRNGFRPAREMLGEYLTSLALQPGFSRMEQQNAPECSVTHTANQMKPRAYTRGMLMLNCFKKDDYSSSFSVMRQTSSGMSS
jgi:hypothetical protein